MARRKDPAALTGYARPLPHPREPVYITGNEWVTIRYLSHDCDTVREYDIGLDQVDSPLKLLDMVRHVSLKTFFDGWTCRSLIVAVVTHFGWDKGGGYWSNHPPRFELLGPVEEPRGPDQD